MLIWHLVWLILFGSPTGVLDWLINYGRPSSYDEIGYSGSWFRHYALFYFVLFPLVMFAIAIMFAWNGRAFRREHRVGFLAVILAALSPSVYVAVLAFLTTAVL